MSSVHSFDIRIAEVVGVQAATIFYNLCFWVEKEIANQDQSKFHDGVYWTYNSRPAFAELYPYMTERQISYALKKLEEERLIFTGCFNKSSYDKTLWYTVNFDRKRELLFCQADLTNLSDRCDKNVRPIPYINTDINTDNIYIGDFDDFWSNYPAPDAASKGSKKKAKEKYLSLVMKKPDLIPLIAKGVKDYAEYIERSKSYVKHATTWLGGADWETEWKTSGYNPRGKSNADVFDTTKRVAEQIYREL